ncbi:MAG: BolA/IbaG family iron-sulfur metabolism protein [Methylophilaceae bacterium]|nr:BolA/IbaG family iron-sulfur metabolism protein [Methylophilaceae bacterium]
MMSPKKIKDTISANIICDFIEIKGDDGTHFEAIIVSKEFENISVLKQHQLVYSSLGEMMQEDIHALSIKTYKVKEWNQIIK